MDNANRMCENNKQYENSRSLQQNFPVFTTFLAFGTKENSNVQLLPSSYISQYQLNYLHQLV